MAYFDLTHPATAGRPSRTTRNLIASYLSWREARQTRAALSKLSDRELSDIGLIRADLDTLSRPPRAGR